MNSVRPDRTNTDVDADRGPEFGPATALTDGSTTSSMSVDEAMGPAVTPEELEAAAALARALDDPHSPSASPDADLARALRAMHRTGLAPDRHEEILQGALARAEACAGTSGDRVVASGRVDAGDGAAAGRGAAGRGAALVVESARPKGVVLMFRRASIVAAAALSAAAGFALMLGRGAPGSVHAPPATPPEEAALVPCRSTQGLFDAPFAREGGATARIDRIATARGRELRANGFSRRGVR